MRFLFRAFGGLLLLVLAAALLGIASVKLKNAFSEKAEGSFKKKYGNERIYSAYVERLKPTQISPKIMAYGEAKSWRSLELRAASSGRLIFLSKNFREGGMVSAGETLFKIDPREADDLVKVADVNLLETRAELSEAQSALSLVQSDLSYSEEQLKLRLTAVKRQKSLNDSGIVTTAAVENSELLLSNAYQAVSTKKNLLAQGSARIARANISVTRAKISLEQARRQLLDSEYRAPFSGVISKVSVVPGRLLNKNEQLGVLIDTEALEVGFQVSNLEFSRMVDENGTIIPLIIRVIKDVQENSLTLPGIVQRVGAEVISGTAGRQVFASLKGNRSGMIRAGDFLMVEIEESPLKNVAIIPSVAVDTNSKLLILGENDRLEEIKVEVLRRQSDKVIISAVPFGREYVIDRPPYLDAGLRVKPIRPGDMQISSPQTGNKSKQDKMVQLSQEERSALITFVEKNDRMPKDVKETIIKQLQAPKVSLKMVNRFKSRMEGN